MNVRPVDIVRARWLEAADTDMRLPWERTRPSTASGFWPAYEHTFEDKAGWGTARLKEERELRARRTPPSAAAIRRHDEVMNWTADLISEPERRLLVWKWAFCIVGSRSFANWIRETGRARATAYRRLEFTFDAISLALANNLQQLPECDPQYLRQIIGDQVQDSVTLDELPTSPTSWSAPGEQPSDLPENRDFSWADKQAERHARREAKRRKLLGVEG